MDQAVVTAVSPLMVRLDSSATAVPALCLGAYVPVVNDRVVVDQLPDQAIVLGTTGPSDPTPIGRIVLESGTPLRTGYLACNGASVLRATYPLLAAYYAASTPAYPYGTVDGTHMTLPNIPSGTFLTGGTPGATGGAATHTLTTAEMPSHNHTQDPHGHTVGYGGNIVGGAVANPTVGAAVSSSATSTTTATNQATGGGGSFPTVPPFVSVVIAVRAA